jgi:hypothetical protein
MYKITLLSSERLLPQQLVQVSWPGATKDETDTSAQVASRVSAATHPSKSKSMQHCNAKRSAARTYTYKTRRPPQRSMEASTKASHAGISAVHRLTLF